MIVRSAFLAFSLLLIANPILAQTATPQRSSAGQPNVLRAARPKMAAKHNPATLSPASQPKVVPTDSVSAAVPPDNGGGRRVTGHGKVAAKNDPPGRTAAVTRRSTRKKSSHSSKTVRRKRISTTLHS